MSGTAALLTFEDVFPELYRILDDLETGQTTAHSTYWRLREYGAKPASAWALVRSRADVG